MQLAAQTHLKHLRDALDYRLRELRVEVDADEHAQRELTGTSQHEVTDRKDDATLRQSSDVGAAQAQRDFDEMSQVEADLQRMDGWTYGDCDDCGKPVSLQRLQEEPAALRCAPCQVARELTVGRSSSRAFST